MASRARPILSRETRLLAATIGVSLVVLLVLARFRFPDAATPSSGQTQPLSRLAARAAFDDLSLAVRELSSRVGGSLLVVRITGASPGIVRAGPGARPLGAPLALAALRVRDDTAVVLLPDGAQVEAPAGLTAAASDTAAPTIPGASTVVAHDLVRGIALVRVPAAAAPVLSMRDGVEPLIAPGYVVVAEGSVAGAALRPVFVGRSDAVADPRWDTPLLTVGRGAAGDIGAPVFLLDGSFAGLLTSVEGEPALLPAQVLMAAVDQLLRGAPTATGDLGISTQALDPALMAAAGVGTGAAVAAIESGGPAESGLRLGDVITAVNGQAVGSPDALRLRVMRTRPGTTLALTVWRDNGSATVPVTVRARTVAAVQSRPSAAGDASLGLIMRAAVGTGSEVTRVLDGSAAAQAGLRSGDEIVRIGKTAAPTAADVSAAFAQTRPGAVLFLSVRRDRQPLLVALRR